MTTGSLMDRAKPFQSIKAKNLVEDSGKRLHVRQEPVDSSQTTPLHTNEDTQGPSCYWQSSHDHEGS